MSAAQAGATASSAESPNTETARSRRHFGNLLSGEMLNKGLRFIAAAVLARALTLEDYGIFNVGIAISGVLVVITSLGLPDLGSRDVAVAHDQAGGIASRVVWGRLIALTPVSVLLVVIGSIVWPGHLPVLLAAALMGLPMAAAADWLLRGIERMRAVALATAAGGATAAIGSMLLLALGGSATSALLVFAAAEFVATTLCWRAAGRGALPRPSIAGLRAMLSRSWPLALSSLAIYSYLANIDTIIMAGSRGASEAGLYSAPYRLFLTFNLVPVFAAYAVFPIIARAANEGRLADAHGTLRANRKLLACYGIAVIGATELIGKPALGLLFGNEFEVVSTTFVLLTCGVAWYAIGYPDGYGLIAESRNRGFLAGALTAGGLNLILDLLLIPPLGPRGAGLATATAFMAAGLVWILWRGRPDRMTLVAIAAVMLASSGAVLVAFGHWPSLTVGVATMALAAIGAGSVLLNRSRRAGG